MKPENNDEKIVTSISVNMNSMIDTPHPALLLAFVAPRCKPFARNQTR